MRFLGHAEVYDVPSFTDGTKTYRVVVADDPVHSSCDCPAFVFNKRGRPCKHITHVEFDRPRRTPRAFQSQEVRDVVTLFRTALTWVDDDEDRAADLVEAYLRGRDGAGLR